MEEEEEGNKIVEEQGNKIVEERNIIVEGEEAK